MAIDTPRSDVESNKMALREDGENPQLLVPSSGKISDLDRYKNDHQSTMVMDRSDAESDKKSSREDGEKPQPVESTSGEIPELAWDDVQVGRLLGKGGFANVNEAVLESGEGKDKGVYAIKYLKDSVMEESDTLKTAVEDLVSECKMLAHLQHEHIVKLHGISEGLFSDPFEQNRRIFLIVDLVPISLNGRIDKWRLLEEDTIPLPFVSGLWESERVRLHDRLRSVAIPLAKVLKHLHSKNIVYRDLKPSNVGFDVHGTLKLYDFGLAREIKEGRKMSMNTGTPCYMAPEVASSTNYGLAADIYSFSLILWEVATLKVPFEGFNCEIHTQKVLIEGVRPMVDYRCGSVQMQQLITKCWDESPKSRPDLDEILAVLEAETSRELAASNQEPGFDMHGLIKQQLACIIDCFTFQEAPCS